MPESFYGAAPITLNGRLFKRKRGIIQMFNDVLLGSIKRRRVRVVSSHLLVFFFISWPDDEMFDPLGPSLRG